MARRKWIILVAVIAVICAGVIYLSQMPRTRFIGFVVTERPITITSADGQLYATPTFHSYEFSPELHPGLLSQWITLEFEGVEGKLAYYYHPVYSSAVDDSQVVIHGNISRTISLENEGITIYWTRRPLAGNRETAIINLSTAFYVTPGTMIAGNFYIYPVFQRPDGRVYLTAMSSHTFARDSTIETFRQDAYSSAWSQTPLGISSSAQVGASHSVGGGRQEEQAWIRYTLIDGQSTITITIRQRNIPLQVDFFEKNVAHNIVAHTSFSPAYLPEVFNPGADTEYIIVETLIQAPNPDGADMVQRQIINRGDSHAEVHAWQIGIPVFEPRFIWVGWDR